MKSVGGIFSMPNCRAIVTSCPRWNVLWFMQCQTMSLAFSDCSPYDKVLKTSVLSKKSSGLDCTYSSRSPELPKSPAYTAAILPVKFLLGKAPNETPSSRFIHKNSASQMCNNVKRADGKLPGTCRSAHSSGWDWKTLTIRLFAQRLYCTY